jgi:hypothetical protein
VFFLFVALVVAGRVPMLAWLVVGDGSGLAGCSLVLGFPAVVFLFVCFSFAPFVLLSSVFFFMVKCFFFFFSFVPFF